MTLEILEDYEKISERAARIVAREILTHDEPVLGLPTGNTPKGMYDNLVNLYQTGLIDFSRVKTFNLDEYYPLSEFKGKSFKQYMKEHLYDRVNLRKENTFIPDGRIPREQVEDHCRKYENLIDRAGGIDLLILGIGPNGHIGFNEPGSGFGTSTRLVTLKQRTRERNFDKISRAPSEAVTMGIKTVMNARKILLLASGGVKADALERSLSGKITEEWPCSVLQLHPNTHYVVDKEAAGNIDR